MCRSVGQLSFNLHQKVNFEKMSHAIVLQKDVDMSNSVHPIHTMSELLVVECTYYIAILCFAIFSWTPKKRLGILGVEGKLETGQPIGQQYGTI